MNVFEGGLHLTYVEVVLTGVSCEVVEDLLLLLLSDPLLLVSASHGSSAFFLINLTVVVSINLVEDVFNLDISREYIRDG